MRTFPLHKWLESLKEEGTEHFVEEIEETVIIMEVKRDRWVFDATEGKLAQHYRRESNV